MLIKLGTLGAAGKAPHRIICKLAPGVYRIEHPEDCECQILWSVEHAHWVSYDMARGRLFCDRCKQDEIVPCPSRQDHLDKNVVFMAPEAVEDDLKNFQLKHENCRATIGLKEGNDPPL